MSAIDGMLDAARARLRRLDPEQAAAAARLGALLVDTRPVEQRRRDGEIPGALVVDRNVLEWRLDPTSPDRVAEITSADQVVILVCHQGYSSSLAAATLQDLGLRNATDLAGGFAAWAAAGLPVTPHRSDEPVTASADPERSP
ncbi:MAG TPA: rhodanese-like domain-containing protein [Candidatus Dormibacteraeota bacterium]|jgi:rhodanese-related sulfurtransferase|nr:rhodanese-like domain-containing protein [Candidatus Dormibacteraeota bacterium]